MNSWKNSIQDVEKINNTSSWDKKLCQLWKSMLASALISHQLYNKIIFTYTELKNPNSNFLTNFFLDKILSYYKWYQRKFSLWLIWTKGQYK